MEKGISVIIIFKFILSLAYLLFVLQCDPAKADSKKFEVPSKSGELTPDERKVNSISMTKECVNNVIVVSVFVDGIKRFYGPLTDINSRARIPCG